MYKFVGVLVLGYTGGARRWRVEVVGEGDSGKEGAGKR